MKKTFYYMLTITLALLTSSFALATSSHTDSVTLYFQNYSGQTPPEYHCLIKSISFQQTGFNITTNQPWNPPTITQVSNGDFQGIQITVECGHQGSSSVANYFSNTASVAISSKTVTPTFNTMPQDLNFVISGTLTVTNTLGVTTSYPVVFGEGHMSSGQDNWWFGGANFTTNATQGKSTGIVTSDYTYVISQNPNGSDASFYIQAMSS